jgi:hypothetical protein
VGYRIIGVEFESPPIADEEAFIRQVAAFADSYGVGGILTPPERYPGQWEIILDANSSLLDGFTPYFIESVDVIANDIDPGSADLRALANYIGRVLSEQIVSRSGRGGVAPARPGRELLERIDGEASYPMLDVELDLHEQRVRDGVAEFHALTGPTAWRRRHDLRLVLWTDALALTSAARRLQRIASDLQQRLPSPHLRAALERFDQAAPGLIDLRNIAEHLDDYTVGKGRIDAVDVEPGDVFEMTITDDDVIVAARGREIGVLALRAACVALRSCLQNASDCHLLRSVTPPFADFDFIVETGDGPRYVRRHEETPEQVEFRTSLTSATQSRRQPRVAHCEQCGEIL